MKYLEIGLGNRWLIRTEYEDLSGTEYEVKGWQGPIHLDSFYLRLWLGKRVWILDSKEGFKQSSKQRSSIKLIFGIKSLD